MDKRDDMFNHFTNTSYLSYNYSKTILNSLGQCAKKNQQKKILFRHVFIIFCLFFFFHEIFHFLKPDGLGCYRYFFPDTSIFSV